MEAEHRTAVDELKIHRPPVENLSFQSLSEYAVAKMLERYCGWEGHPGVTFQVPAGRATFDFRSGYHLIEYHPINLHREPLTDVYRRIGKATKRLSKDQKAEVYRALEDELGAQYIKRRSQIAAAVPELKDCEVFCLFNGEQVCYYVMSYGNGVPSLDKLKAEWKQHIKAAKKLR